MAVDKPEGVVCMVSAVILAESVLWEGEGHGRVHQNFFVEWEEKHQSRLLNQQGFLIWRIRAD